MKAAILTPMYLSFSWVLTISYQIFTDTAVKSVSTALANPWPSAATWLSSNLQTVSFVYAFSWIFVLSSVLPSLLLGRGRSVLVQYTVCLILTFIALSSSDIPIIRKHTESIIGFSVYLGEPVSAVIYLLTPFILMLVIDVRGKRRQAKREIEEPIESAFGHKRGGTPS